MDNQFSQARLDVPTVSEDFEAKSGSSKADFARALLLLLKGAQILGINPENPNNFDLVDIQTRLKAVEAYVGNQPKQRVVSMNGVSNGLLLVPFDDIGTTNYLVNVIFITANVNINTVTWSLIDGSKLTNQVSIRIDGDANPYKVEVQILENKS